MTQLECLNTLIKNFNYTPTSQQEKALEALSFFLTSKNPDEVFILKGYAGTGKTTIITTLLNAVKKLDKKSKLLAPTGRAAKVIKSYSGKNALTIHKEIYYPTDIKSNNIKFTLKQNKNINTIFIVDEASMIPDIAKESKFFENGSLLHDLMLYISSCKGCKLICIGDTAQLPPVKSLISPALNSDVFKLEFNKKSSEIELNEVVRHGSESGILHNATSLRHHMDYNSLLDFKFETIGFKDIIRLSDSYEIEESLSNSYSKFGEDNTCVITRSNKRAYLYNKQIREKIFNFERNIEIGDLLMVVKNNYFWVGGNSEAGFVANGDTIKVKKIYRFEKIYGFHFAQVKVSLVDYPNQEPLDTTLLLDTITSDLPALSYEDRQKLYQEILKDFSNERTKYLQYSKVKKSPFFNALQVKFAYGITCHKSQGGQWDNVFVEQPYLPNGLNEDVARWLYTAITRAKKQVFLIGFSNDYFSLES